MTQRHLIRWSPPEPLSPQEEAICRRLHRTGRLFRFLRLHRHRLFDEAFQARLAEMYADTPSGRPPVPPALLVMVTLLQAYTGASDAEAVQHALFDKRWQLVLDCLDCERAPFSEGLLATSRARLLRHDLDRELIRRSVALAQQTGDFGHKVLKVALDSAPIWGRGRVADTFNLIGAGLMQCVTAAASAQQRPTDEVLTAAQLQLVGQSSVKAALDIDWDDAAAQKQALQRLLDEAAQFRRWVQSQPQLASDGTLQEALQQLDRLIAQDTEPDPDGPGARIIEGTAKDRQISVGDPEMRHGRKSKSTTVNGYQGHVAIDLEQELVLEGFGQPANVPEAKAADEMRSNVEYYGEVVEFHSDRGFLAARWVEDLDGKGVPIYCKPYNRSNGEHFPKSAFAIDVQARTVTCPAGEVRPFPKKGHGQVPFTGCSACGLKARCTDSKRGRCIDVHENEALLQRLWARKRSKEGRAQLRKRVGVEHVLSHVLVYQPHQARYVGARKLTFGLRRAGTLVNLQAIDRAMRQAA